jgi:hypothetical protein
VFREPRREDRRGRLCAFSTNNWTTLDRGSASVGGAVDVNRPSARFRAQSRSAAHRGRMGDLGHQCGAWKIAVIVRAPANADPIAALIAGARLDVDEPPERAVGDDAGRADDRRWA